jgi:hypothetical protein
VTTTIGPSIYGESFAKAMKGSKRGEITEEQIAGLCVPVKCLPRVWCYSQIYQHQWEDQLKSSHAQWAWCSRLGSGSLEKESPVCIVAVEKEEQTRGRSISSDFLGSVYRYHLDRAILLK